MTERPIMMGAESIAAILAARKTETRRVVKPQPQGDSWRARMVSEGMVCIESWLPMPASVRLRCPYGDVGDRLWVRETWAPLDLRYPRLRVAYRAGMISYSVTEYHDVRRGKHVEHAKQFPLPIHGDQITRWRSPMMMPRWASRLTLEITRVRVERLQDMTADDARAEGVLIGDGQDCYRDAFVAHWNHINAKRGFSWAQNPWVFAVTFRVVPQDT